MERSNDGECSTRLTELMAALGQRGDGLDYAPVRAALKESWALWYSEQSPRIEKMAEDEGLLIDDLEAKMKREIEALCTGQADNMFSHIDHALGRTVLYENNSNQSPMTADFALKSWKQVEKKTAAEKDLRYLSSAYYNIAYYTIVSKAGGDYVDAALGYLNKAKDAVEKRMEDSLVQMHCAKTFAAGSMFENHTADLPDRQPNLMIQVDNRFVVLDSFQKNINELINKLTKLKAEEGGGVLAKSKDISKLFKDDRDPILTEELSMFIGDGHFQIFDVEKEPVKGFCWSGLVVTLLGLAQIVGGVLLCTFSAGVASSFGLDLIIEGVSDVIAGVEAMVTGVFSWAQWALSKIISMSVSLLCFGFSQFKWVRAGGCFTKTGAKQSLKQAFKYAAKTAVIQAGLHVTSMAFDAASRKALEAFFESKKAELLKQIKSSKDLFNVIRKCLKDAVNKNFLQNENQVHSLSKDVKESTIGVVATLLENCMQNAEWMNKFNTIMKQWTGPLTTLVTNTVLKNKGNLGEALRIGVNAVTAGAGVATALKSYKELSKFVDTVIVALEEKLKEYFKLDVNIKKEMEGCINTATEASKASKNKEQDLHQESMPNLPSFAKANRANQPSTHIVGNTAASSASSPVRIDNLENFLKACTNEIQAEVAKVISDFVWEKSVDITSGLINSTVKVAGQAKLAKAMDKFANLDHQRGYFADKQNSHAQFHQDRLNENSADMKSASAEEIAKDKENKPADAVDVLAISKKTGKTILIETLDEHGEVIKVDKCHGESDEVIHVQNIRTKNKDGSYSGHFEMVDKDGRRVKNTGEDQTCLYQAVLQHEGKNTSDLTSAAKEFRASALKSVPKNVLTKTVQRQNIYNDTSSGNIWHLSGGGARRMSSFAITLKEEAYEANEHKTIEEAIESHLQDRIDDLPKVILMAKQANGDKKLNQVFTNAATHQDHAGDHKDRIEFDPSNTNHTGKGGMKLIKTDGSHTFCMGLQEGAASKDKRLVDQVSKVNLMPRNINARGGLDIKIDQAQREFMKENYDRITINKQGELQMKDGQDFNKTYHDFLQKKVSAVVCIKIDEL